MGKIIAVGGGEIGRPGTECETVSIDREIVKQAGKKHPLLLFLPTASKDSDGYVQTVKKYFGEKLGCRVEVLYLSGAKAVSSEGKRLVQTADIVYVGGGNTAYALRTWRHLGVDKLLALAYKRGAVMSGVSAGANCWFKFCTSDSRMMANQSFNGYIRVRGLGFSGITMSPHHLREPKRQEYLIKLIGKYGGVGVALDDYTAIEIIDGRFRILSARQSAGAHKVYRQKGAVHYDPIPTNKFLEMEYLA